MPKRTKDKGRIGGQFVPLLHSTLDSPAWRATSHGARSLYVALRRRIPRERNRSYVSYRTAERELKSSRRKIREWFAELEHYGFIRLVSPGCLGVDGVGKAPHWTLTELGQTSRASADGLFDPPTNDFRKWDGTVFDTKAFRQPSKWDRSKLQKQNPGDDVGNGVVTTWETPLVTMRTPPKSESGDDVVNIKRGESGDDVVNISSLTTGAALPSSLLDTRKTTKGLSVAEELAAIRNAREVACNQTWQNRGTK